MKPDLVTFSQYEESQVIGVAPTSNAPDAELAARLHAGDSSALELLYWRHAGRLLRLAFQLTGSREDAEDIVHDVFLGLQKAVRQYSETGRFASWLGRITVRVAMSRMRYNERRKEVALPDDLESSSPTDSDRIATSIAVTTAVLRLPPPLRAVFVLSEIEHYSHAEIAALLGISRINSAVRLHRALRLLRDELRETI
jgi:RNA polymerase sigma-70 factor (ECF subfamily)